MPLQVIETTDPLAQLISFRTSAVFQMLISTHNLRGTGRHLTWAKQTRARLGSDLVNAFDTLYAPYGDGLLFIEIAIDYPEQDNVPGFIDYVRHMPAVDFLFYLMGRVMPREHIAQIGMDAEALQQAVPEAYFCCQIPLAPIIADVGAFQNRLADLWQRYWESYFAAQIDSMLPQWSEAIAEKQAFLDREGGEALLEHISGYKDLPEPLPPEMPYRELVFIPIVRMTKQMYLFYGYGNITLLFDAAQRESREVHREQMRQAAINTFKALSDDTRLRVLRTIAHKEGMVHGKLIAEKIGLSASAVSRHLSILKDGGLIVEDPQDNRITYRLNKANIERLADQVLDYLYS